MPKPTIANWHLFLTVRYLNGLRRTGHPWTQAEAELYENLRESLRNSADLESIRNSKFKTLYPPIK